MTKLDFSNTWVGSAGCRALLRALRFKRDNPPTAAKCFEGISSDFVMLLNDAVCSGSSGGTSVDFDDPNGDYALDLADPCDRAVAAELWEAAVRGEAGQENWRGEAIDGRTINISESANEPWQIPLEGELTVFFTSYPKTPAVDSALADIHFRDLIKMMQVVVMMMLLAAAADCAIDAGYSPRISKMLHGSCDYRGAVRFLQAAGRIVERPG